MSLLVDRVVLVTGASEGVGREMVRLFAEAGARVGAVARRADALAALAAEIGTDRVLPLPADVRKAEDLQQAATQLLERWGRIDALVNNAGVAKWANLTEMSATDFQWQLDVNLTGVFHACKAVLPHMLERARAGLDRPAGQVLNIGSVLSVEAVPRATAYCATKWGLLGFTESLRLEVQPEGIRVMALLPGLIQTEFGGRSAAVKGHGLRPESVAWQALQMLAAPADAQPETCLLRHFNQPK